LNVLITGPTGVGKSYLGAALAHSALRISRKEGQRFTACRSMVSRHVGPVLMKQDVLNFLSETNIRQ
jgi:predicted GTPase